MKATVYIGTSIDGFIADTNGNVDWLEKFANHDVFEGFAEFMKAIDAVVVGRGTFEKVLTYPSWPYSKKVFVLSTTLTTIPQRLGDKAEILSMRPRDILKHLEGKGFSRIYVDGGRTIQNFLRDDCIDEMIISTVPVLLGSGIPLFGALDVHLMFKHEQTDVFSNGLVKSRYVRKRT